MNPVYDGSLQTVQTLLHLINEIGTGSMKAMEGNTEVLIGSSKMLDVGNEVTIPDMIHKKSDENYQYTHRYRQHNMETLCHILIKYLQYKKDDDINHIDRDRDYYVAFKRSGANLLQFHDFYLCEQGYMIAKQYLDNSEEYAYDHTGLAELAAIIAIHMFHHLTIRQGFIFAEYDLSQCPGGMFTFKEGLNLEQLIEEYIQDIEGIWRYEEEEEYDDDWE